VTTSVMNRIAALVLALLVLATGCKFDGAYDLPLPGGPNTVSEEDGYEITADFTDVLNVVPRTPVMVDDVPVGQVLEVERVGWHAKVTMRVRQDVVLPGVVIAEVRQTSLLGEKYIALAAEASRDASGQLSDGDHIPLAQTGRNPEVEEVLGALSFLLSGGGVAQIKTISQELNAMMSGRSDELRDVLGQVESLVTALNGQKDDLITAFDSVNELSRTLVDEKQVIADALDSMGPALDVLNEQHDALVRMLSELDELGVVGTRVINATKDDLIGQLRHLEPVLRRLADVDNNLVPGLVSLATYPFPLEAADTIKGDYANVAFLMQIKLTPVSEGGLIPSTLQELQQLCLTTPLAPVCTQNGTAVDQLCAGAPGLPLCRPATRARVPAVLGGAR
jgi:phospholipid/cholesterol/gamma-HCH transport system substrate-binding protein